MLARDSFYITQAEVIRARCEVDSRIQHKALAKQGTSFLNISKWNHSNKKQTTHRLEYCSLVSIFHILFSITDKYKRQ
jgi:hypothetical protein